MGGVSAGNNGTKAVLKEDTSYHGELGMEGSEPGGAERPVSRWVQLPRWWLTGVGLCVRAGLPLEN